jgi:hypothetical protein
MEKFTLNTIVALSIFALALVGLHLLGIAANSGRILFERYYTIVKAYMRIKFGGIVPVFESMPILKWSVDSSPSD